MQGSRWSPTKRPNRLVKRRIQCSIGNQLPGLAARRRTVGNGGLSGGMGVLLWVAGPPGCRHAVEVTPQRSRFPNPRLYKHDPTYKLLGSNSFYLSKYLNVWRRLARGDRLLRPIISTTKSADQIPLPAGNTLMAFLRGKTGRLRLRRAPWSGVIARGIRDKPSIQGMAFDAQLRPKSKK